MDQLILMLISSLFFLYLLRFTLFATFRWLICQDQTLIRCSPTWPRMDRPTICIRIMVTTKTTPTENPALANTQVYAYISFLFCCWQKWLISSSLYSNQLRARWDVHHQRVWCFQSKGSSSTNQRCESAENLVNSNSSFTLIHCDFV